MHLWWPLEWVDQDFGLCSGSLLRWHSLLSWSYGLWWFKEVRNGVRGFMCVISVRGLSSLDAWSWGFLGIFTTSLGFAKCFRKPLFIFQVIFIAWRSFHSHLKPKGDFVAKSHFRSQGAFSQTISQPMEKIETFSQPILKLENHFVAISKLGDHFIAL